MPQPYSIPKSIAVPAVVVILGISIALINSFQKGEPMGHGVYIWQRKWTPELATAIQKLPDRIGILLPLGAEISFPDSTSPSKTRFVDIPHSTLSGVTLPIEAVIRIGDSGAQTGWNQSACEEVSAVCRTLRNRFATNALPLAGIQIDYDCPASKLGDYERLLTHLRDDPELANLRLSLTALPSWIETSEDEFQVLTDSVDYFVLQVHALELPESPNDPARVIDPASAKAAVGKAARFGCSYFVALPTYASFLVYSPVQNKVIDVMSEDLNSEYFQSDNHLMLAQSPPAAISSLIREWEQTRPKKRMKGVFWYRLPVATDRMNWPLETWKLVLSGTSPRSRLEVVLEEQPEGFAKVLLKNLGQQPESDLPESIELSAPENNPFASGDGGHWYRTEGIPAGGTGPCSFRKVVSTKDNMPLPIGGEIPVGWIRLQNAKHYEAVNWTVNRKDR